MSGAIVYLVESSLIAWGVGIGSGLLLGAIRRFLDAF